MSMMRRQCTDSHAHRSHAWEAAGAVFACDGHGIVERSVLEQLATATVLRLGNRVIITVAEECEASVIEDAQEMLRARLPEVEFMFITGVGPTQ